MRECKLKNGIEDRPMYIGTNYNRIMAFVERQRRLGRRPFEAVRKLHSRPVNYCAEKQYREITFLSAAQPVLSPRY